MQGLDKHSFCEHGKRRSLCKEGCGWGSMCEHGKKRSNCPEEVCGKHLFCEHGKRRNCCNKGCGKQPSAVPSADIVVTGTFAAVSLLQPHVPDRRATREAHAASRLDVWLIRRVDWTCLSAAASAPYIFVFANFPAPRKKAKAQESRSRRRSRTLLLHAAGGNAESGAALPIYI